MMVCDYRIILTSCCSGGNCTLRSRESASENPFIPVDESRSKSFLLFPDARKNVINSIMIFRFGGIKL